MIYFNLMYFNVHFDSASIHSNQIFSKIINCLVNKIINGTLLPFMWGTYEGDRKASLLGIKNTQTE